jgi:two-component system, OmpR family, response regulator
MRPIAAHPDSDPFARSAVVIDVDPIRTARLTASLTQQGFSVHEARDGYDGIEQVRRHSPDLVTVEIDLPGIDGFETVRRIREFSDGFIVMITADDSESAVVEGFRSGADDYVVEPVGPYAFRARIDALMRRSRTLVTAERPADDTVWLEHGPLRVHPAARRVEVDGRDCELTRSEFDLLRTLVRAKNQVFSKSSLALMLREANGLPGQHITAHDRHAVEVHIMNLRRKLGDDPRAPQWIETVRGLGYRLAPVVPLVAVAPARTALLERVAG